MSPCIEKMQGLFYWKVSYTTTKHNINSAPLIQDKEQTGRGVEKIRVLCYTNSIAYGFRYRTPHFLIRGFTNYAD